MRFALCDNNWVSNLVTDLKRTLTCIAGKRYNYVLGDLNTFILKNVYTISSRPQMELTYFGLEYCESCPLYQTLKETLKLNFMSYNDLCWNYYMRNSMVISFVRGICGDITL